MPIEIFLQISAMVSLVCCAFTNPGIIPQIVDRYEWDLDLKSIPSLNHNNLSEHKYLV